MNRKDEQAQGSELSGGLEPPKKKVNIVYGICRKVVKITDEELAELEEVAKTQLGYLSPLKCATMGWQHALGNHNLAVVAKVRELRDLIVQGAQIKRP
jgi:hypothetical protein